MDELSGNRIEKRICDFKQTKTYFSRKFLFMEYSHRINGISKTVLYVKKEGKITKNKPEKPETNQK